MALLEEARQSLQTGKALSKLEQNGVLHALQVLIENAIGKAKQILKANGEPTLVSAYDAFSALARIQQIPANDLSSWNSIIGLRNRIVHEYMNIDMQLVLELVKKEQYKFVVEFLLKPVSR